MLKAKNPLPGDDRIRFDAESHTYWVDGAEVPISVTGLISSAVPEEHQFNAKAVIHKNLLSWRRNASSKYNSLVNGKTDEEAEKAIMDLWAKTSTDGTAVHAMLESVVNGETVTSGGAFESELFQFHEFLARNPDIVPCRSEMSVFGLDANGKAVIAGQIDLVLKNPYGDYEIIDFKRVSKDLAPHAPHYGKTWLGDTPLNDHYKYSIQCFLYAALLEMQTGKAVTRCHILQVHADLDEAILTECSDMKLQARVLLRKCGVAGF